MKNNSILILVFCCFLSGFYTASYGQNSRKKRVLEARKKQLKKDIVYLSALRSNTIRKEKNLLKDVAVLNSKIEKRESLLKTIEEEASLLKSEIKENDIKIKNLEKEISSLKEEYASLIYNSYKGRSKENKLLFLLSSDSFFQGYKRMLYMKQHSSHRKEQGLLLKGKQEEIELWNDSLLVKQKEKDLLVVENRKEREKIQKEKKEQEALIEKVQEKQDKYLAEIEKRQKEEARIDRQIEKLIKKAIAESNTKPNTTSPTKPTAAATNSTFALTPEAKVLAGKFSANKGKLPWPVEKGVVTLRYGTVPHPIVKSLTIQSNGVRISTEKGMKARAVFDGTVLAISVSKDTGIQTVMVQHGNYITVYENLVNVLVNKGDKVSTKQAIGTIHTDVVNNDTVLKFQLWKETTKQNPAPWILKM